MKKELSNEARLLIAFVLMGLVLFLTPYIYKPASAPAPGANKPATSKTTNPAEAATAPPAPAAAARIAGADRTARLWAAAGRGDVATLRLLLATHMALDGRDPRGQTALLQAVRHGEKFA